MPPTVLVASVLKPLGIRSDWTSAGSLHRGGSRHEVRGDLVLHFAHWLSALMVGIFAILFWK
jgi:hypothetical protein